MDLMFNIEYLTRFPAIGEWLLGSLEYRVALDHDFFASDARQISGEYRGATLKDNMARTWHLLLFYFVSVALIINSVFITVRYVKRSRKEERRQ